MTKHRVSRAWRAPGFVVYTAIVWWLVGACSTPVTNVDALRSTADQSVHAFLTQSRAHGVPLADALALGPQATTPLRRVLTDESKAAHWSVAASALAMLGEPDGVAAVIAFIEVGAQRAANAKHVRWARGNAVLSLGYAVHRSAGDVALEYLIDSLSPATWRKRFATDAVDDNAIRELIEEAIVGLALAAQPRSRKALEEMQVDPLTAAELQSTLAQALSELTKIESLGIEDYDRQRWR